MGEEENPKPAKDEPTTAPPDKPQPLPQEIVLKVYMHCEGCARKVRKCLAGFDGVEDVATDCKSSRVVVKGEKADPLKVLERLQKKSHRQVVLLSPIPEPKKEEEKKPAVVEEKPPAPEEPAEKIEEPQCVYVVLKVHMHCEACAMEIKKRILRMKGVESVDADLKCSEVSIKGVFDPKNLVEHVHKRTGKHAVIVKQETEKKEKGGEDDKKEGEDDKKEGKEEKKEESEEKKAKCEEKKTEGEEKKAEESEVKEKKEDEAVKPVEVVEEATLEMKKKEYYYPPVELMYFTYPPPQIFSDENPNACTLM